MYRLVEFGALLGMPVLKVVGPIPATAWIPLAMVVAPSSTVSAVGVIALAWFPVTMLLPPEFPTRAHPTWTSLEPSAQDASI